MHELDSLFLVNGVVAALRFYDDGTLAEATGQLDQLNAELAAELCYANGRFLQHNSDMFMTLSGKSGWAPRGWMMAGDELSVCGLSDMACFVRNSEVSFSDVFRTLAEINVRSLPEK
jgi:roadblock/LC7 domain-containing protein